MAYTKCSQSITSVTNLPGKIERVGKRSGFVVPKISNHVFRMLGQLSECSGVCSASLHFGLLRSVEMPLVGPGHPFPLSIHFLIFCFFYFSHFPILICFTYFLLLSIPSPFSTRVVPLCFQAGGGRRWQNLGLVCSLHFFVICIVCYLYCLVKLVKIFGVLLFSPVVGARVII